MVYTTSHDFGIRTNEKAIFEGLIQMVGLPWVPDSLKK